MEKTINDKLQKDFEWFISYWVGKSLHDSKVGKFGLRWKMTKVWNSRMAHAGIPGQVRDTLGEEDATRLFQDISDDIIKDPAKLAQATKDFESFGQSFSGGSTGENLIGQPINSSLDAEQYLLSKGVTKSLADISVLTGIISTLAKNNVEYELFNFENEIFISAKAYGKIYGNRLPLRMESIFGSYDPMKSQTDEFVDLIEKINIELKFGSIHYEHISDPEIEDSELGSASHVISDLTSLQNGGKLSSFIETIIYYNSKIDTSLTDTALMELLLGREDDKGIILDRLKSYEFDETEEIIHDSSVESSFVIPKTGEWTLPNLDLLNDSPEGSIKKSGVVPLKSILKTDAFMNSDQPLTFALGTDSENKPVTVGLQMLGAIMAAGQTGSGKSTFTETTLLLSLLFQYTPDELKLVLIDPKVVQFPQYNGIPHLLRPVITDPTASHEIFDWLLSESKRRIERYDRELPSPFIVIVIDEVSDLMAVDKDYFESAFSSLAESADKTGIYLYIGTSRPSPDIYTDKLKKSIGGRIVFKTASEIDSVSLLDEPGAEQLAGYGEMIFKPYHGSETIKLQSPYASDNEVVRVTDFWRNQ